MIKLNSAVYKRLLAQAKEAKDLELNELADGVLSVMGPAPRDENEEMQISRADIKKEIYKQLWKVALDVVSCHALQAPDIQKLGEELNNYSETILSNIENSLNVKDEIGAKEPKVPGQLK